MKFKVKSFLIKIIGGANIATILIAMILGYSDRFDAAAHALLSASGMVFPVFALLNAAFLMFWVFFWWRGIVIPVIGFVLIYFPMRAYCPFNVPQDAPDDAVKLLTMNVMNFNYPVPEDSVNAFQTVSRYVQRTSPDIACFVEFPPIPKMMKDMSEMCKYSGNVNNNKGNVLFVLSRYPIIGKERIMFESVGNLSAAFHLLMDRDTVTLVVNHFQSICLSKEERQEVGKIIDGTSSRDIRNSDNKLLVAKVVEAIRYRAPQVDAVTHYVDSIRAMGRSVLLCGDFNESPISYSHHQMEKRLVDCYSSTATGPGFTFEQNGMHFRIDHIFCSDDWTPYRCEVVDKMRTSDHYPMLCWLKKGAKP